MHPETREITLTARAAAARLITVREANRRHKDARFERLPNGRIKIDHHPTGWSWSVAWSQQSWTERGDDAIDRYR